MSNEKNHNRGKKKRLAKQNRRNRCEYKAEYHFLGAGEEEKGMANDLEKI
jgi:hypothetical protein